MLKRIGCLDYLCGWIIAHLSCILEHALAQPLVPSTALADAWIQVDRTENPRFSVNLLDATRARFLQCRKQASEVYNFSPFRGQKGNSC